MSGENKLIARPVEQTPACTFASVHSVLNGLPFSDATDDFLLYNSDVLLLPMPFHAQSPTAAGSSASDADLKHLLVRGVLYEGALAENINFARKLALWMDMDVKEVLRVVLQTKKRVPELPDGALPELVFAAAVFAERRTVLDIASRCFQVRFYENFSMVVRNIGKSYIVTDYVTQLLKGLRQCQRRLEAPDARVFSKEITDLARSETLLLMVALLRFLHALLVEQDGYETAVVHEWFQFVGENPAACVQDHTLSGLVASLSCVISLKMLELGSPAPYFSDGRVFSSIAAIISTGSNIVKYGLLLSLYRKSVLLEGSPAENKAFLADFSLEKMQLLLSTLLTEVNDSVFSEIRQLSQYFHFEDSYQISLVELILAALPVVTMNDEIVSCIGSVLKEAPNSSVEAFFDSPDAQQLFTLSRAKFPMLMVPFLRLAAINGDFALHELEELRSYMQAFDSAPFSTLSEIDSENTNLVRLTQQIDVYPQYENSKKLSLLLTEDTKAQVFRPSDAQKVWVTFLYKYNGWAFLGRVLENISKSFDAGNSEKMTLLLSILQLIKSVVAQSDEAVALEYLSAYTDDEDILDVFHRLLEQCLHHRNAELLATILDIFSRLMPLVPITHRIWQYLSTSSLFSRKGREGFASIIFGSTEMVRGDYSFTLLLARYAFDFAENCLSSTDEYPQSAKAEILAQITEHLLQVFQASCNFDDGYEKLCLKTLLLDYFSVCLVAIYSIAPDTPPDKKATRIFAISADKILDAFLASTNETALPIFNLIESLASHKNDFLMADKSNYYGAIWARTCLKFAKLVVRIRSSTKRSPSPFEKALFLKLPEIVTIYAKGGELREYVLELMSALTSGKWHSEPSILSHLGRANSRTLLHSLGTDLENPFDDQEIKISIYKFLCALMEANQQGLSVFLISGRDVFGEFLQKETPKRALSLLTILKKNVNDINYHPPEVTVHLLDAISLAFSLWTTARNEESDLVFVQELVSMMKTFKKTVKDKEADLYRASYQCKLYAKVAENLSLLLFTTKNEACKKAIVDYLCESKFLADVPNFFSISGYTSLYDEVNAQFSASFPGYKLSDFSTAFKERNHFGFVGFYDWLMLDSLFEKNPQWPEIRDRIFQCSANIQYYSAQFALAKSMGGLLTTFCRRSPKSIPASYATLALQLLKIAEPNDTYTRDFYKQQHFGRIELAFLLLYTQNGNKANFSADALQIVDSCLDLMADATVGYLNFAQESDEYSYRSLLRIVYVALSQINGNFELIAQNHQILMRVFDFVVAKGTRGLIFHLENQVYLSRKKRTNDTFVGEALCDFELILSILKLFTQMKLSRALQAEIMASLDENKTIQAICSLHTFSHLALVGNNEPVFAQLSLMFIQQFLSIDEFCDNLGKYNLFTVIRESIISRPFKDGGVSVESNFQLHRNWINGVLPILVTCLSKNSLLNEVILTMRAFQRQIEFCAESWTKDSSSLQISTAGTFETMQILYIFKMLHSITSARGMAVESASDVDMSILPGFDTQQKRANFVDFVNNLLKHPKFLASRIYPSTKEEEQILGANDEKYHTFVRNLIDDISELKVLIAQ